VLGGDLDEVRRLRRGLADAPARIAPATLKYRSATYASGVTAAMSRNICSLMSLDQP
jgi:hypothetical protein